MKILWLLLLIMSGLANEMDENTEELLRLQSSIENNHRCEASIALRFNTSTVVLTLSKVSESIAIRGLTSPFLVLDKALTSIVGANESDSRLARLGCIEYDSEHRIKCGDSIAANLLALRLSDDIQASLQQGEKPLPFNCLIISTEPSIDTSSGLGSILKVDIGGNFESCRAVSIGYMSSRINKWLETRGVYIASQILDDRAKGNDSCSCPCAVQANSTDDADISNCMSILWNCLHENFGLSAVKQNFTVEISTIQQTQRTNLRRVFPRTGHFFRPTVVPPEVFLMNQTAAVTDVSDSSLTEGYSDVNHIGSTRLFRWWRLQRDKALTASKSGMTLQWRKLQ